jgi:hypothetical protein
MPRHKFKPKLKTIPEENPPKTIYEIPSKIKLQANSSGPKTLKEIFNHAKQIRNDQKKDMAKNDEEWVMVGSGSAAYWIKRKRRKQYKK